MQEMCVGLPWWGVVCENVQIWSKKNIIVCIVYHLASVLISWFQKSLLLRSDIFSFGFKGYMYLLKAKFILEVYKPHC